MKKRTLTFRLGKLTPGHPCCICNVSSGKGVMVHDQGDPGDAYLARELAFADTLEAR